MASKKEAASKTGSASKKTGTSKKKAEGGTGRKAAGTSGTGKSGGKVSKSRSGAAERKKRSSDAGKGAVKARMYQPHETYEVGEIIRHPVWNEDGEIKSVSETPDGIQCIIVDFGERGTRRLVVDYSLKL